MKRCPQCGREYDNSMSFCLDDGAELLYGPARTEPGAIATGFPADEPQTGILHSTAASGKAQSRAKVKTTDQTAIFPRGAEAEPQNSSSDSTERQSLSAHRAAKPLIAAVVAVAVLVGGFFGYRYISSIKQIESIAVMPFVNESGNVDVEYLSDGMTETLIKSLSQLPKLAVKSRSTVFYYKGKETAPKKIGEELGVQAVLLGRVGGRGDEVKVSLELVNTQTQDVIWSEQYDGRQGDLVALQSEIAKDVSARLKSKLSGADEAKLVRNSTTDPEAYQAYLKGRYHWNRRTAENLKKAIEQFKAAIDKDPNYALAYAGLADCYFVLNYYTGIPISETIPKAKAFAERAIAIDDQLAEPHASLAAVNEQLWQWAEAEREYRRAIELNPNYATAYQWYSGLLRDLGRFDEAALMIKRAHEIDPLSSAIGVNISSMYDNQNDHDSSIQASLKVIELDPDYSGAYGALGLSQLKKGRHVDAIANLEKAVDLSNRAGVGLSDLGYGYGFLGKRVEAVAIANELKDKYERKEANGRHVAAVYAGLRDKDKAFEWLEKDFESRGSLASIRWEIPFESLRDDPRSKDLLKRMNLPE
jgi:TolB-like protein/Flp pilus assembly protein TadD